MGSFAYRTEWITSLYLEPKSKTIRSPRVICTINTGHQVRLLSIPVVIHELLMFEFTKLIHVQNLHRLSFYPWHFLARKCQLSFLATVAPFILIAYASYVKQYCYLSHIYMATFPTLESGFFCFAIPLVIHGLLI